MSVDTDPEQMTSHALQPWMAKAKPRLSAGSFDDGSTPIMLAGVLVAMLVGAMVSSGSPLGVALLGGLVFTPIVLLNLPLAAILWIPLIFVDRINVGPTLIAIMLAAAWLALMPTSWPHVKAFSRRNAGVLGSLALLVGWVALSVAWAADPDVALTGVGTWFITTAVFVAIATLVTTPRLAVMACLAFVAGALLSLFAGVLIGAGGTAGIESSIDGRFSGSLGDPNELAAGLVPAMALTAGLAVIGRRSWRWPAIAVIAILAAGLGASGSRGGLVAALAITLGAFALARGKRIQWAVIVGVGLAIAGLWIASTSSDNLDRIRQIDDNGTGRADLWTIAWRMGSDNPAVGVGTNNFRNQSGDYLLVPGKLDAVDLVVERPLYAHNIYLQQFAETGIIGIVFLLAFLTAVLLATFSAVRTFEDLGDQRMAGLARAILLAQVGVLTASTFLSNTYDKRLWVLLAIGVAMRGIAKARENESQSAAAPSHA